MSSLIGCKLTARLQLQLQLQLQLRFADDSNISAYADTKIGMLSIHVSAHVFKIDYLAGYILKCFT